VPGCGCEWVIVSKTRHLFCETHLVQANELYRKYKEVNSEALVSFSDEALDRSIALREEYASRFLDFEDTGAHSAYISILKKVRGIANNNGQMRRFNYNRWMTESRYFSDFTHV
jgi:hypothetical protein